jgi:Pyridine nucleotide-disulphide oxidoreductase
MSTRTIAIIGAGPIGLEAALAAAERGWTVSVYEAGKIGEHLRRFGETTLFTPFESNSTPLGRERLAVAGARLPQKGNLLSALDLVERYLLPLSRLEELRGSVHEGARVTHIAREGLSKSRGIEAVGDQSRERRAFLLRIAGPGGAVRFERADVVVDATGVVANPNATGPGGVPAVGENEVEDRIQRHLPPGRAEAAERYAGRRVLILGDGHSAATSLCLLDDLARDGRGTACVEWIHRDRRAAVPFVEVPDDPLPARGALTRSANRIASSASWLRSHPGAVVTSYESMADGSVRVAVTEPHGGEVTLEVDRVLALVGYRPEMEITRELQIHHCYASEGPMKLASAILSAGLASPGSAGDCLSQVAHGPESLRNPEPGFFILGAKSYGRNPAFLLSIGHQQIRDALTLIGAPLETAPSTAS